MVVGCTVVSAGCFVGGAVCELIMLVGSPHKMRSQHSTISSSSALSSLESPLGVVCLAGGGATEMLNQKAS